MTDSQKWLVLALVVSLGWLLLLLAPVLTPFLVAALLAYLFDPMVNRLQQRKLPRTLAAALVLAGLSLVLVLLLLLLVPMLEQQIVWLIKQFPYYFEVIQQKLPVWAERLGIDPALFNITALKQMVLDNLGNTLMKSGGIAVTLFESVSSSGMAIVAWISNLFLIPVVLFYLLRDWDVLLARIDELLPRGYQPLIKQLATESDLVLGGFLRGQLSVMLALALIYSLGLWLAGLELALLIGMLAGLVSFVPYLGFIVGIIAASVAMLLQTHELMSLLPIFMVFGVGQMLESMLLTPWLVGDRIGLHPVAVIFAVMAGGQLFGFVGVLLALPTAAVLAVLLRYAHQRYKSSTLYEPAVPTVQRQSQHKRIRRIKQQ
ncbi:MAG TPA: AI-2E family transporter [Gammaproteobacteria bacterium]|nr:AI-2E family transporter [Gammaproteobacteria bacterium]